MAGQDALFDLEAGEPGPIESALLADAHAAVPPVSLSEIAALSAQARALDLAVKAGDSKAITDASRTYLAVRLAAGLNRGGQSTPPRAGQGEPGAPQPQGDGWAEIQEQIRGDA